MVSEDRWRKVSEEMPLMWDTVLVYDGDMHPEYELFYRDEVGWVHVYSDNRIAAPTHWRPLPAPPEED